MILKTFPDKVNPSSKIYKYIDGNVIDPKGVYWNHQTISDIQLVKYCAYNRGCWDVSKERVMELWEHCGRVGFKIDLENHNGKAVEKSNQQYKHDGRIVTCPIEPLPNKVYQKFIDSSINKYEFVEYRVFYHWGVDFVIEKVKEKADQWGWKAVEINYREPEDVFTGEEIEQIDRFCRLFGMDFGELDILKDENVYIIDVNNIAGNGSNVLSGEAEKRYIKAVERLCQT